MFQAVHSWRGHSDHQQIEAAIPVEIRHLDQLDADSRARFLGKI